MLTTLSGKKVAIVAIIVVAALLFVNSGITGYFSYTQALEKQVNSLQDDVSAVKGFLNSCSNDLTATNQSLAECGATAAAYKSNLAECVANRDVDRQLIDAANANLTQCRASEEQFKARLEISDSNYAQLAANSAKSACCSFGDAQSGTVRQWSVINNSISCTGNRTVNCTSGATA